MPTSSTKTDRDTETVISPSSSSLDKNNNCNEQGSHATDERSPSVNEAGNAEIIPFRDSSGRHVIPSGLSALIQAATAQLGELVDEGTAQPNRGGLPPEEANGELAQQRHSHQLKSHTGEVSACDGESSTFEDALEALHSFSTKARSKSEDEESEVSKRMPYCDDRHHKDDKSESSKANTTPLMVPEQLDASKGQNFPNTLMTLALDPNNEDTIAFLPDGKYFAIRAKKFATELMPKYFDCSSWRGFLLLMNDWGFSRILHDEDDDPEAFDPTSIQGLSFDESISINHVEVFRHPKFIQGNWTLCADIRFGESPTDARLSALPERAIFDYASATSGTSENQATRTLSIPTFGHEQDKHLQQQQHQHLAKRRLSPRSSSTIRRRNSDFTTSAASQHHRQKKRMSWDGSLSRGAAAGRGLDLLLLSSTSRSLELDHSGQPRPNDIRSIALALTSEKLNLRGTSSLCRGSTANTMLADSSSLPYPSSIHNNSKCLLSSSALVDQAVQSATHTIVTDAIETLLHDEYHTKETYLKHSQELSRSSLPGVVPLSKQLFEQQQQHQQQLSTNGFNDQLMTASTRCLSEEETASAIVAAAIAAEQRAHAASTLAFMAPGPK
ncbi:hypothetical protein ACA910_019088 [Epithemia clementina (nom. ined.)]